MRKIVVALLVATLLVFTGVFLLSRSLGSNTSVEGRWVGTYVVPVEFGGGDFEVSLWFTDGSHFMFRNGCNTGGARYKFEDSELTFDFTDASSTAVGCAFPAPSLPDSIRVVWGSPSFMEIPSASGSIRLERVIEYSFVH